MKLDIFFTFFCAFYLFLYRFWPFFDQLWHFWMVFAQIWRVLYLTLEFIMVCRPSNVADGTKRSLMTKKLTPRWKISNQVQFQVWLLSFEIGYSHHGSSCLHGPQFWIYFQFVACLPYLACLLNEQLPSVCHLQLLQSTSGNRVTSRLVCTVHNTCNML